MLYNDHKQLVPEVDLDDREPHVKRAQIELGRAVSRLIDSFEYLETRLIEVSQQGPETPPRASDDPAPGTGVPVADRLDVEIARIEQLDLRITSATGRLEI